MAEPWENFGAPAANPAPVTQTPAWENFGAPPEAATPTVATSSIPAWENFGAPKDESNLLDDAKKFYRDSQGSSDVLGDFLKGAGESIDNQGGWGLSAERRQSLGANGPIAVLRPITDLPANLIDLGYRGVQALGAGTEGIAQAFDKALDSNGVAGALSVAGHPFHPGALAVDALNADPLIGGGAGHADHIPTLQKLFDDGATAEVIQAKAVDLGTHLNPDELKTAVDYRDKGGTGSKIVPAEPVALSPEEAAKKADEVAPRNDKDRAYQVTDGNRVVDVNDVKAARREAARMSNDIGSFDDHIDGITKYRGGRDATFGPVSIRFGHPEDLRANNPFEAAAETPAPSIPFEGTPGLEGQKGSPPIAPGYQAIRANEGPIATEADYGGAGRPPSEPPVPPSGGEPPAIPPERPTHIGNINLDKGGFSPEHDPFLAQAVEHNNFDPVSHREVLDQAAVMRSAMSPEERLAYDPKQSEAVAHSLALRADLNEAVDKATKLAADISDPAKNTEAAQAAFAEAMTRAGLVGTRVSENANFAGRLLNSHGIRIGDDASRVANAVAELGAQFSPKDIQMLAEQVQAYKADPFMIQKLAKSLSEQNLTEKTVNALNIPRAIQSSIDMSAPLRQGFGLIGRAEWWKALPEMVKYLGNEKTFEASQRAIRANPDFRRMLKSGLYLAGDRMSKREEAFMSSYAEKIPVLGRGIKASERAYVGFLNKIRADTFSSLVAEAEKAGTDFGKNPKALHDIAKFINTATGRGSLGESFDKAAPLMSAAFYSPRLMASRVQMLNPAYYVRLDPFARKQALKSLLAMGAFSTTLLGLAKTAGMGVEIDPTSSDFGKAKWGNTRYEVTGGAGPYIRLAAQFFMNYHKTAGGKDKVLDGKFGNDDFTSVLGKFARTKLAPIPGAVLDVRSGKDVVGQPVTVASEAKKLFVPMFLQDMQEVYSDQKGGFGKMAASAVPGSLGIGVQTYPANDPSAKRLGDLKEDDPVLAEVHRLDKSDSPLITSVGSTAVVNDEKTKLSPDQKTSYQKLAGQLTAQKIRDLMSRPSWQQTSDDDKREMVKDAMKDAKQDARDQLFD